MLTDDDRRWRVAVIPTRGDRPEVLARCVEAIEPQVHRVIVVDNSDEGQAANELRLKYGSVLSIWHSEQPPNLSMLWNLGLRAGDNWWQMPGGYTTPDGDRLKRRDLGGLHTAILNDDAIVPHYWFDELVAQMASAGAVAGGYGQEWALHRIPGQTRLSQRLPGYAFILRRGWDIFADENLRWWCGDNDLDMQARRAGGTLVLPNDPVIHLHPDQSTRGVLALQTGFDMAAFVDKWGFRPW